MALNYEAILERIAKGPQDKLSPWEQEFIESVYEWHILKGRKLTEKQEDTIKRIISSSYRFIFSLS